MINNESLQNLLQHEAPEALPRISIYVHTYQRHPDNEGDPIRYKNLVADVERKLEANYPRRQWENTLKSLYALQNQQTEIWNRTKSGLAVFAVGDFLKIIHLEYRPESLGVVAADFHVLPLFAYLESRMEALLVDLSKDRVKFHTVSRYAQKPYNTDDIKTAFPELFDDFDHDSGKNVGSYGGLEPSHHGHRAKPEEVEKDREKYFRYLDRALTAEYQKHKRPVLMSGTTENLAAYRQLIKGDFYLDKYIDQPFDSLSDEQKQTRVVEALEPSRKREVEGIANRVGAAISSGKVEKDVAKLKEAAKEGRLAELVVDLSQRKPGDTKLDELIREGAATGTDIHVLANASEITKESVIGVLRY